MVTGNLKYLKPWYRSDPIRNPIPEREWFSRSTMLYKYIFTNYSLLRMFRSMLSVMPWAVGRFYRPTVDENRSNNEKVIHKTKSDRKKYLRFEISEYVPNSHSHSHWNDENCEKHKTRDSYLFKTSKIIKIGWITKKLWWFQKPIFLFKKKRFRVGTVPGL